MKYFFVLFFMFSAFILQDKSAEVFSQSTQWVSTTDGSRWNERPGVVATQATEGADLEILLDKKAQKIEGFGGCFNEKGWEALSVFSPEKREFILNDLFGSKGCKFTICRMPMGASDYAIKWYSYNENPGDFEMEKFSIEPDQKYLIPYIKAAQKVRPDLKIWASPWSPPSWMKKNNNYASTPSKYNEYKGIKGKSGENLINTDEKTLTAYALYFSKFYQAYKNEGIDIVAVHVQNEFHSAQIFPSCTWQAGTMAKFIGSYLGPRFEQDNIPAEIWLGTMERPFVAEIDTILKDELSKKYVKGVGFQWGGRPAVLEVRSKYKEMNLMQTESECGDGSNDWKAAEYTWSLLKSYIGNGVNSYMYWNMVLEQGGTSTWGWKQNAMISVNVKEKSYNRNPEYYVMKHFSYFIENGAYRLNLSKINENVLAFQNPDGKVIVIIYNERDKDREIKLKIGDKMITPKLSSKSFNTIAINL